MRTQSSVPYLVRRRFTVVSSATIYVTVRKIAKYCINCLMCNVVR